MTRWYVVNTHPHQEGRADANLRRQGFESWLPKLGKTRRHARRVEQVQVPLFPGYLFVRLSPRLQHWRSINSTFGVRHLLCTHDQPAPISDSFVEALQQTMGEDGLVAMPKGAFRVGDKVRLITGPFADMVATLIRAADGERVAILLNVLGREVQAIVSRRALTVAT